MNALNFGQAIRNIDLHKEDLLAIAISNTRIRMKIKLCLMIEIVSTTLQLSRA